MTAEADTLKALLSRRVEPWMEVLFVGLSPELLEPEHFPTHLSTVRHGGNVPQESWDAAFIRCDPRQEEASAATLADVLHSLRHGGQCALVALPPAPDDPDPMIDLLSAAGRDPQVHRSSDGAMMVVVRQLAAGRQDLVGLRRCLSALAGNVERLEALCGDLHDRAATRRPVDGGRSVKELVGLLGDRDRDVMLACARRILEGGPPPAEPVKEEEFLLRHDHNARPLAELVTRFRHFRYQAMDLLDGLHERDWLATGPGPDLHPTTVADLVRTWSRQEASLLEDLARRVG